VLLVTGEMACKGPAKGEKRRKGRKKVPIFREGVEVGKGLRVKEGQGCRWSARHEEGRERSFSKKSLEEHPLTSL
jgi:hypothetical protein